YMTTEKRNQRELTISGHSAASTRLSPFARAAFKMGICQRSEFVTSRTIAIILGFIRISFFPSLRFVGSHRASVFIFQSSYADGRFLNACTRSGDCDHLRYKL